MGKQQGIPLIQIPMLKQNRSENNGKLLRRPQPRPVPPITHYASPPESPSLESELGVSQNRFEEQEAAQEIINNYTDEINSTNKRNERSVSPIVIGHPPPPSEAAVSPSKLSKTTRQFARNNLESIDDYNGLRVQLNASTATVSRRGDTRQSNIKSLLKTTVHSGPDGLPPPPGRIMRNILPFEMMQEKGPSENAHLNILNLGKLPENDPSLRINDFLKNAADNMDVPLKSMETIMYSSANVKKLTEMIYQQLTAESHDKPGQITLNDINLQIPNQALPYRSSDHAVTGSRVPQTQILIQMASMLTDQIQAEMEGSNIKAMIRPFPKWTPSKPVDEQPKAEIVLYEEVKKEDKENRLAIYGAGQSCEKILLKQSSDKHFMDSRRNQSPYDIAGDNGLTNTDIAVLDALINGGAVLSLKAHFIDKLPDISPMYGALRYINLAFNNFDSIPGEILILQNLEVLKLRNNPISEIPDEIRHLKRLRTLELPFCLIEELPEGLYTLKNLQYLDVSYNKLTTIPPSIRALKSLQVLFVEGNQLVALPCACLSLPNLRYIRVRNNFMHPVFWPEHTHGLYSPMRLQDLAGLLVKQMGIDKRYGDDLPDNAKALLLPQRCDCCHGHLSGEGLTLIRPGSLFGVKNVPFMFKSCSHYCAKLFMANTESLVDLAYADSEWNGSH